jgi:hypothetical protein
LDGVLIIPKLLRFFEINGNVACRRHSSMAAPAMHEKGKALAVLVATQMQQVAILDVDSHRRCVPAHSDCASRVCCDSVQCACHRDSFVLLLKRVRADRTPRPCSRHSGLPRCRMIAVFSSLAASRLPTTSGKVDPSRIKAPVAFWWRLPSNPLL